MQNSKYIRENDLKPSSPPTDVTVEDPDAPSRGPQDASEDAEAPSRGAQLEDAEDDNKRGPIIGGSVTFVCTAYGSRESISTGARKRQAFNFRCVFKVRVAKGASGTDWVVKSCCFTHAGDCAPCADNLRTRVIARGGQLMARLSDADKAQLMQDIVSRHLDDADLDLMYTGAQGPAEWHPSLPPRNFGSTRGSRREESGQLAGLSAYFNI